MCVMKCIILLIYNSQSIAIIQAIVWYWKKENPYQAIHSEKIFHFVWNCPVFRVSMAFSFQGAILVVAEKGKWIDG